MQLYRTVRPQDFDRMVGSKEAVECLHRLLSRTEGFPQVIGLSGPSGCGKTTLARIAATKYLKASGMTITEINLSESRGIDTAREIQSQMEFLPPGGGYRVFILDECFSGDTLVSTPDGNKEISSVQVGDVVLGAFGPKPVEHVHKNRVPLDRVVQVHLGSGKTITCSKEHRFFTGRGWVSAWDLTTEDFIFTSSLVDGTKEGENFEQLQSVWRGVLENFPESEVLFQDLLRGESRPDGALSDMREGFSADSGEACLFSCLRGETPSGQLLESDPGRAGTAEPVYAGVSSDGCRKGPSGEVLRAHENPEPIFYAGNAGEDVGDQNPARNLGEDRGASGREREVLHPTDASCNGISRGIYGVRDSDEEDPPASAQPLQGRFGLSESAVGSGGGREHASGRDGQDPRREEGYVPSVARVVGVARPEPGSLGLLGIREISNQDRARGYVEFYDLAIKSHPSYFAGGALVHNCHKATPEFWNAMLKALEDIPKHCAFFICTSEPQGIKNPAIHTRLTWVEVSTVSRKDLLTLVIRTNKEEALGIPRDALDLVVEASGGSPRKALVHLDAIRGVTNMEEISVLLKNPLEVSAKIIDLCRALVSGAKWGEVAQTLAALKEASEKPEGIRIAVTGYCQSILLKGSAHSTAAKVLEIFASATTYNDGFPAITLLSYQAVHS